MKYNYEISPYGNMLVYKRGYSVDFVHKVISENKLSGLRIFDHLDKLESLDFLEKYDFLEKLDVNCMNDQDYSFLMNLPNLKSLGIGLSVKENNAIDLSSQVNLENLTIQWRKGKIFGIEKCQKINSLCITNYTEMDFNSILSLQNLEDLKIKTASIKSINGIENYTKLKSLYLGNCKKLSSIEVLKGLRNITFLSFELCPQVKDYASIGYLFGLENIQIIDCKEINTIKFIETLPSLKKLSLLGNTDVVDGDLLPAKNIKEVFYKHRKHYNAKIENKSYDNLEKINLEKIKALLL
jgi:hypothetical protein